MRTIYHLLFQREFNTDLYNENHLSSSFSERVQYWSIQWEPCIVFFFRESTILIYTMRTIYHPSFQREFNADLYNENHLLSSFSERVQYWSIQWKPFIVFFFRESSILIYTMRTIYRLLFQREFNTDLYNDNHLSPSFSERVQYWSIQWDPFISFFFRESSILIYTMRTIYRLLFQREFNTDLYNENHLSSSFSERVQYWSIQWEPFIVFFFRESTILIYTMRTIYLLLFQREFNTDLYNENHLSSSFSERVQYWSILMRTIYRLLFQREFNTDIYNENHLSPSFSERVQYWSIQWEPFIVFFFRESSILIYTMRTIYRLLFQREFNTDLYNENHLSSSFSERVQWRTDLYYENHLTHLLFHERVQLIYFQRESSILIYTMRTIYLLLFQREFNLPIQWEPWSILLMSSILIYTMRTIYCLLFQREYNTDLYNENHLSFSFFRESSILIYTIRTINRLLFQREFNTDLYNDNHLSPSFSERV